MEYVVFLFCGGVIVYLLFKCFGVGFGKRVGVVGVGGLGYFVVLFVCVFGVEEVVGILWCVSKR